LLLVIRAGEMSVFVVRIVEGRVVSVSREVSKVLVP